MKGKLVHILLGLVVIIISSYLSFTIPIAETGIPFTMQSLIIFLVAAYLSWDSFFIVIILYLIMGSLGLPVFAEGSSGIDIILGASGGFLYGFAFAGLYISYFIKNRGTGFIKSFNVFLEGTVILFVFGLAQLAIIYDYGSAIEYGLKPFWKMALVKALLCSIIYFLLKTYLIKDKG